MKASKLFIMCLFLLVVSGGLLSANAAFYGNTTVPTPNNRDLAVSAERGEQIGRDYLAQNAASLGLTATDVSNLRVTDNYAARISGARYVYFQQEVAGIGVFNAMLNVTILPGGEVLFVGNRGENGVQQRINSTTPAISAEDAVRSAADSLDLTFSDDLTAIETLGGTEAAATFTAGDLSLRNIPVKLVYQPVGDDLRLAWDLSILQTNTEHWWTVRMDAETGELLHKGDWIVQENWEEQRVESEARRAESTANGTAPIVMGPVAETPAFAPLAPDSYKVYPIPMESPYDGNATPPADGRAVVTNPANSTASPFGWHDTNGAAGAEFTTTQGNNVYAYTDTNDDDQPDPNSSPSGGAGLDFNFPITLNQQPSTYQPASVTNLFYMNNIMHDIPYLYGFDEMAGNFQQNNYGKGGLGTDFVHAQAQDGGGFNNANFGTPPDGQNPLMQMYLGDNVSPMRDGSLDNGVIAHEYGHGISNRLTGGPTNTSCLENAEQGGEGWGDWEAMSLTMKSGDQGTDARGIGNYLFGYPANGDGIRLAPYSTDMSVNDYTYSYLGNLVGAGPHPVGFVWNTAMWEVNWALIGVHGFNPNMYEPWNTGGNNLAYQLIQDGMAIQPCSPGFVDARDAIIAADVALTGGANKCTIWTAFAKRGLGAGAAQGSSDQLGDETESFTIPAECNGVPTVGVSDASFSVTHNSTGSTTSETLTIQNTGMGTLTWNLTEDNNRPTVQSDVQTDLRRVSPLKPDAGTTLVKPTDTNTTPVRPTAGEIVADGGFEQGTTNSGWEVLSTNFDTVICNSSCSGNGTNGAHSGNWWIWFAGIESYEIAWVWQDVVIPNGNATLSFWVRIPQGTGDGYMTAQIDAEDVIRIDFDDAGYDDYKLVTVDISAYADGGTHELQFFNEQFAGGSFFVDDVSISAEAPPTPTPTVTPTATKTPVPGQCDDVSNIPWLSASPANGSAGPNASNNVTLTFNSAGLTSGTYTAQLCLHTNAPSAPLTVIPVTLNVGNGAPATVTPTGGPGTPTPTRTPQVPPADHSLYLPLTQK